MASNVRSLGMRIQTTCHRIILQTACEAASWSLVVRQIVGFWTNTGGNCRCRAVRECSACKFPPWGSKPAMISLRHLHAVTKECKCSKRLLQECGRLVANMLSPSYMPVVAKNNKPSPSWQFQSNKGQKNHSTLFIQTIGTVLPSVPCLVANSMLHGRTFTDEVVMMRMVQGLVAFLRVLGEFTCCIAWRGTCPLNLATVFQNNIIEVLKWKAPRGVQFWEARAIALMTKFLINLDFVVHHGPCPKFPTGSQSFFVQLQIPGNQKSRGCNLLQTQQTHVLLRGFRAADRWVPLRVLGASTLIALIAPFQCWP